jgi:hypothetical protein
MYQILFGSQNAQGAKGPNDLDRMQPYKQPPTSYMDPKWKNPTAKYDPVTRNIAQKPSNPDPLNWKGIAAEQAALKAAGGAGGGSASPAPAATNPALAFPDPRTNLNPLYDAAAKRMMELNTGLTSDFDAGIAAIQKQYAATGSDQYDRYQGAKTNLDASAAGLGVQGDQIYKGYDPALRRVQENADLQKNASVDFMEKLKVLRGQQFTDMQASLEQQRAKALADQTAQWVEAIAAMQENSIAGKSGGGSGRGGGGGSSGSTSQSASEASKSYDPEFYNEYLAMKQIDPKAAETMMEMYLGSQSSPSVKMATEQIGQTSAQLAEDKYNPALLFGAKPYSQVLEQNRFVARPGAAKAEKDKEARNRANAAKLAAQRRARQGLVRSASGSLGNAQTTQTVTTKGK